MASLNRVTLIGNFTRDPQSKQLPGGTSVCEFGLAMNRRFNTSPPARTARKSYSWTARHGASRARSFQQYCTKGKPLFIEGRLKLDTWDDKQGGSKRSKISVVVDNFQFLGAPGGGGDDRQQHPRDDGDQRPQRRPGQRPPVQRERQPVQYDEPQFKTDDIPF
jgi:single-strand DNA-binding protein